MLWHKYNFTVARVWQKYVHLRKEMLYFAIPVGRAPRQKEKKGSSDVLLLHDFDLIIYTQQRFYLEKNERAVRTSNENLL